MKYVPPLNGDLEDPERPWVDANPSLGEAGKGSRIASKGIEHPIREIVNAITALGGDPTDEDLTQLGAAIVAYVGAQVGGKVDETGDTMSGPLGIAANSSQLLLRNTTNDATVRVHETITRGSGAGTYGELVTLGDAANGVADLRLRLMSSVGAVLASFEFKSNGRLLLGADPSASLEAATKNYVDTIVITPDATTSVKGKSELATDAETLALADTARTVTPSNLGALVASTSQRGLVALASAAQARAKSASNVALTPSNLADGQTESAEIAIVQGSTGLVPHGLGAGIKDVDVWIRCKTAEAGFSFGEEVKMGWNYTLSGLEYGVIASIVDSTNVSYTVGDRAPAVYRRDAPVGDAFPITPANWRIFLRPRT